MRQVFVALLLIAGGAAPAFAQLEESKPPEPESSGMVVWTAITWPTELNDQPLVMSAHMFQIHLDAFANLSTDAAFEPFALSPDILYGVTDRFTVGLVHNVGLCLTGDTGGCPHVYNDVGLQARFLVKRTYNLELASVATFEAITFDPFALAVRIGALFKYKTGRLAFFVDPNIKFGLTERYGPVSPNKETLAIPIRVSFQLSNKLAFYARTGIAGAPLMTDLNRGAPLDHFGDGYAIPLGIGTQFGLSSKIDFGAEFQLPALIWPGRPAMVPGAFDVRELFVYADYRI